jgi:putative transposase
MRLGGAGGSACHGERSSPQGVSTISEKEWPREHYMVSVRRVLPPAKPLSMPEYQRRLPHFHRDDAYLFLTWRLWGSLPRKQVSTPHVTCQAKPAVTPTLYPTPGHAFVAADRILDRDRFGPLWLSRSRIARLVMETIVAGESERGFYELTAWAIMPNHVHLLILPRIAVAKIMRWLKGSTARRANQLLERTGLPFWQDESYDHWVWSPKELSRIIRYIEENPVSAGLVGWPWSSGAWQAEPPAPPKPHLPLASPEM